MAEDFLIKGAGLGLRSEHFHWILDHHPPVPWYEILADNHFVEGGLFRDIVSVLRDRKQPVVMHSVGLNLGSPEPLDQTYLSQLQLLEQLIKPVWFSDHLAWTGHEGRHHHDLLPFPFTPKYLEQIADKIKRLQDAFSIPFLIENLSYYIQFKESVLQEWDFLDQLMEKADCFMLLDVNNIYVNSVNLGYAAGEYLSHINPERVKQLHIAGFTRREQALIDTHGAPVAEAVWEFLQVCLAYLGNKPVCIERDADVPEFAVLESERQRAQLLLDRINQPVEP